MYVDKTHYWNFNASWHPELKEVFLSAFNIYYCHTLLEGTWYYLLSSEETLSGFLHYNWPINTKGCSGNLDILLKYELHDLESPLPLTIGQLMTNSIPGSSYWIDFWTYIQCLRCMTYTGLLPVTYWPEEFFKIWSILLTL